MLLDILFVVAIIGILIAIYKTKFSQKKSEQQIKAQVLRKTSQPKAQQAQRLKPQPSTAAQWTGEQQDSEESQSQGHESPTNARTSLYKQQKKRQKQQRKEAQQHFLQQAKTKREEYEKMQQQRERQEQEKRRKQEQYIEQMREQQRKKKEQEFIKWKDMFAVEESGVSKESQADVKKKQQQLQSNLLNYLITKKLTLLEDASHKFSLTTKDLVEKIKKLQTQLKISGVFDQRGKYLFIEQREWDAVRNYISAKGRLKKTDMMNECAKIIKIPDDQDQQLIKLVNNEVQQTA